MGACLQFQHSRSAGSGVQRELQLYIKLEPSLDFSKGLEGVDTRAREMAP